MLQPLSGDFPRYRSPVATEDIVGIPWTTRPRRVTFDAIRGRQIAPIPARPIPSSMMRELERGILDQGWRYGVKSVSVTLEYDRLKGVQLVAEITYGR